MGTTRVHTKRWGMMVVVCLPWLLLGCLVDLKERGTEIDPLLFSQLQPGLSTKPDVLRVLGVPTRNAVVQDHEAWIYDYSFEKHSVLFLGLYNEERKTIQQRGVAVLFADERLYSYVFME
jgi:outer membrane protein assembly factor BamE (lipoprotein component of BamABCDE complex)